jgi:Tol biopolymer transport system component/predicted Ser/Thr protein kinase
MPISSGTQLRPYEAQAPLGAGGMGEVWKARDTRLDRIVAIKILNDKFSERFEREARAVAALNHPHICQLYDVGPDYLVMELIEGTPLKGPVPVDKAVEYAGQILDALDAAHRKGITHRDLKPANILVTKQGIKLLDFGLAKQAAPLKETDATKSLTEQAQIIGTLHYMSPEQLQGKEADPRSDLFSFGCVLYEMLTGKRAFGGKNPASIIAALLEREPGPLGTAPALDRIVKRSLAKDPDQRFQTARDLKAALNWAWEQPSTRSVAGRHIQRWWMAALASAMLILGVLAGRETSHLRQVPHNERVLRLAINPPNAGQFIFGFKIGGIALSPDGRTAAFVASSGGKNGLWVRPLDGTDSHMLVAAGDVSFPFWSPDSKSIGFFSGGKLQRVDLGGGAPFTICDVPGPARGGSWSGDGRIIFGTIGSNGLLQVPSAGGTPLPVTTLDVSRGEIYHLWPQLLPGAHFLYWVRGVTPENTGMYVSSLAKPGDRVRLLQSDTNALYAPGGDGKDYLLWLRGGTLLAQEFDVDRLKLSGEPHPVADPVSQVGVSSPIMNVAASNGGQLLYSAANTSRQFTWLDRSGKRLGTVGESGEYGGFRLSSDGGRIVTSRSRRGGGDLWLMDVERGAPSRLTDWGANSGPSFPVWSANGRTIVFQSGLPNRSLGFKDALGAASKQPFIESPAVWIPLDWSRDGHFILYNEISSGTGMDLWVLPVSPNGSPAADDKPRVYLRTNFTEGSGRFDPEANPRWIAYVSDESGRNEVYLDTFPERRRKMPISTGGGQYPEWGAGGRELFYVSPDFALMVVSLKLGADAVELSAPRELFHLPAGDDGWNPYQVAPDGQRVLVRAAPQQQVAEPLTLIVNWPALMRKGLPAP